MADAPDKIWLRWEPGKAITQGPLTEHPDYTEYTRTDVALARINEVETHYRAMVAAAYLDAANLHQSLWRETSAYKTDQILKRTPDDAVAELERVKREARIEAIEATLAALQRHCNDEWVNNLRVPHVKRMIALMENTGDE